MRRNGRQCCFNPVKSGGVEVRDEPCPSIPRANLLRLLVYENSFLLPTNSASNFFRRVLTCPSPSHSHKRNGESARICLLKHDPSKLRLQRIHPRRSISILALYCQAASNHNCVNALSVIVHNYWDYSITRWHATGADSEVLLASFS